MVSHTCYPSTLEAEEDYEFRVSLGYILRPCFKQQQQKEEKKKERKRQKKRRRRRSKEKRRVKKERASYPLALMRRLELAKSLNKDPC
jgi:DNA modification methylase